MNVNITHVYRIACKWSCCNLRIGVLDNLFKGRGGPQGYAGGHGSNMRNRSYDYTNDAGVQVGRNMNRGMGGGGQGGRQQYGAQGGRNNYGG